ncbi:ABC transporter permease [Rhizobium leucaenae]|jgi:polar amino acid transport system permease protein/octopine/nopaline transport system permease protein|uniref:Polar amino acid transport system permease protein/octopine/nopaline transport system permease protein n=1 Tax=Rhizobium leucaenae TaxID=29450 RepID=A0A7W7EN28_9HYPH|nr:ABC transporter permease subunit [Rhizobium leucaenae]MBB4571666.1 polar amino acid transport system permease protein/octopine/nopaline transport system permease protein [Rhizobium leucaenae]
MLDFQLMSDAFPKLIEGVGLTGKLAILILLLGMILAIPIAYARNAQSVWLHGPANTYILLIRGIPSLLQVFLVYYGMGQLGFVRNSALWPILRDPFWCVIIALGLNSAAYTAEIISGALRLIAKGPVEAAYALGLSWCQTQRKVTIPLAIRAALPAYENEIILTVKATSLASTVTLMDLTGVARLEVSNTYAPYEIFLTAGAIYFCITTTLSWLLRRLEQRLSLENMKTLNPTPLQQTEAVHA